MERRKKYIWGCVLCALLTAVLIGMIYYYNDVRGTDQVSEGTLIWQVLPVLPSRVRSGMIHAFHRSKMLIS